MKRDAADITSEEGPACGTNAWDHAFQPAGAAPQAVGRSNFRAGQWLVEA